MLPYTIYMEFTLQPSHSPELAANEILEHLAHRREGTLIAVDCDDTLFQGNIEMPVVIQRLLSVHEWTYSQEAFTAILCNSDFKSLINTHRNSGGAPHNISRLEQLAKDLLKLYWEIKKSPEPDQEKIETFALKIHYFDEALMEWNRFFSRSGVTFSPIHRIRWFAGEKVEKISEDTQRVIDDTRQGIVLNCEGETSLFVDFHPEENPVVRLMLEKLRAEIKNKSIIILSASNQQIVTTRINHSLLRGRIDGIIGSTMEERNGRNTAFMEQALSPSVKARIAKQLEQANKLVTRIAIGNKPEDSPLGAIAESNYGVFVVIPKAA